MSFQIIPKDQAVQAKNNGFKPPNLAEKGVIQKLQSQQTGSASVEGGSFAKAQALSSFTSRDFIEIESHCPKALRKEIESLIAHHADFQGRDKFVTALTDKVISALKDIDPQKRAVVAISKDLKHFTVSLPGEEAAETFFNDKVGSSMTGKRRGLDAYEKYFHQDVQFQREGNLDVQHIGESSSDLVQNLKADHFHAQILYEIVPNLDETLEKASMLSSKKEAEKTEEEKNFSMTGELNNVKLEPALATITNSFLLAARDQYDRLNIGGVLANEGISKEGFSEPYRDAFSIDYMIPLKEIEVGSKFAEMQTSIYDFLLQIHPSVKILGLIGPPGDLVYKHNLASFEMEIPVRANVRKIDEKSGKLSAVKEDWVETKGEYTFVYPDNFTVDMPETLPGVLANLQANYGLKANHPVEDNAYIDKRAEANEKSFAKPKTWINHRYDPAIDQTFSSKGPLLDANMHAMSATARLAA